MDKLEPDETMKAWFAGFFDGEGTVNIVGSYWESKRGTSIRYTLKLTLPQKSSAILQLIKLYFGGTVHVGGGVNTGHLWIWQINGIKAQGMLIQILPYLKLKREQAKLGIELHNRIMSATRGSYQRLSDEEWNIRREMFENIRFLREPWVTEYCLLNNLKVGEIPLGQLLES